MTPDPTPIVCPVGYQCDKLMSVPDLIGFLVAMVGFVAIIFVLVGIFLFAIQAMRR